MIAFAAKSTCSSLKSDIQKNEATIKGQNNSIAQLRKDLTECTTNTEDCEHKRRSCDSDLDKCKQEHTACDTNLKQAKSDTENCKKDEEKCKTSLSGCQRDNDGLRNTLKNYENEVIALQEHAKTLNTTLTSLNTEFTYFMWGDIGGAVAIVAEGIGLWVQIAANSNLTAEAALKDGQLRDCQGKLYNLQAEVITLKTELERLQSELDRCNGERTTCNHELANEKVINEGLRKELETLHWEVEPIPKLALDQAKLQLLLETTGYTATHTVLFNGSRDSYIKSRLGGYLQDKKPLIFVVRTDDGYVFGGATTISWPKTIGYSEDKGAYTFSTTRERICKVRDAGRAVNNVDDNFIEFGSREIVINANTGIITTGEATADQTYDCGAKEGEREKFYHNGKTYSVRNLLIYHIDIKKKTTESNRRWD